MCCPGSSATLCCDSMGVRHGSTPPLPWPWAHPAPPPLGGSQTQIRPAGYGGWFPGPVVTTLPCDDINLTSAAGGNHLESQVCTQPCLGLGSQIHTSGTDCAAWLCTLQAPVMPTPTQLLLSSSVSPQLRTAPDSKFRPLMTKTGVAWSSGNNCSWRVQMGRGRCAI